jgi:hypothetical protein
VVLGRGSSLRRRAVAAAYRDFIKVEGWMGNLALQIEHEFFGTRGPGAHFQDRYGRMSGTIRGLTVEQHLARLRDELMPLAERSGRVMREALAALEILRAVPSHAVEKSKPIKVIGHLRVSRIRRARSVPVGPSFSSV